MRSHIGGEGNEAFFIRTWKSLPSIYVYNLEGELKRESLKRITSVSGTYFLFLLLPNEENGVILSYVE